MLVIGCNVYTTMEVRHSLYVGGLARDVYVCMRGSRTLLFQDIVVVFPGRVLEVLEAPPLPEIVGSDVPD